MIFRRLRLKTKIAAGRSEEIASDPYVAFYLPCESLFFNRFSDLTEPTVERNRDALVLFFNMAVVAEIASTLSVIPESLGPVNSRTAEALMVLMKDELGAVWDELRLPSDLMFVSEVAEHAERIMRFIRRSVAYGQDVTARGSLDFVSRVVQSVKHKLPMLQSRVFIFMLDDYTEERVPLALQKILHPIICQRARNFCFKISSHMFGSIYSFPQPLALDEGRNINVVNLGSEYLHRQKKKIDKQAVTQIMNSRFNQCEGYKGTLQEWLGKTSHPGGKNLNRALHDPASREKVKYHGIECLLDLCTGDISEVIRIVGEIFREAGVEANSPAKQIDPAIQDKAIRNVSREFLARVRHIRPDGQKLYDVVNQFGRLSQTLLYEREQVGQGVDQRGKRRKDPYDLLTIYVDDLTKAEPSAQRVWERLQRASIFIDIRLAPSQRTVIADRATLRRIYCPAFGTTLSSSEHLQLTKEQFEWFIDTPDEFCNNRLKNLEITGAQGLLAKAAQAEEAGGDEQKAGQHLPTAVDHREFASDAPPRFVETVNRLSRLMPIEDALEENFRADLFIGAMGFEERTHCGLAALAARGVRARAAMLLEFDMYYKATEKRRPAFEEHLHELIGKTSYRPLNAPVGQPDPRFPERMRHAVDSIGGANRPRIIFDCTSCPSLILSKCLRVLLEYACDLTLVYSEAAAYFPTREEWEAGKLKPRGFRVDAPFSGIRYVDKTPLLQADDIEERPLLLTLFPTFTTERTQGVLTEMDPSKRIWLFGEPHDMIANAYRVEMAQSFAAPVMEPGDTWSVLTTFDYRPSMIALADIYARYRHRYRLAVMPHGSKMQTLGVNLFAAAHQVSLVFAVPKDYNPSRYSEGCLQVWAIRLGDTQALLHDLKTGRAFSF